MGGLERRSGSGLIAVEEARYSSSPGGFAETEALYHEIITTLQDFPTTLTLEQAQEEAWKVRQMLTGEYPAEPYMPKVLALPPRLLRGYEVDMPTDPMQRQERGEVIRAALLEDVSDPRITTDKIAATAIGLNIFLRPLLEDVDSVRPDDPRWNIYPGLTPDAQTVNALDTWRIALARYFHDIDGGLTDARALRDASAHLIDMMSTPMIHAYDICRFRMYADTVPKFYEMIQTASAQFKELLLQEGTAIGIIPERLSEIRIILHDGLSSPHDTAYISITDSVHVGTMNTFVGQPEVLRHEMGHALLGRIKQESTEAPIGKKGLKSGLMIDNDTNYFVNEALVVGFANAWPTVFQEKGEVKFNDIIDAMSTKQKYVPLAEILVAICEGNMDGFRSILKLASSNSPGAYTELSARTKNRTSPFYTYARAKIEGDPTQGYHLTHLRGLRA